jgi:nicotinate-nucleotide adenylyltransferase
MEIALFGGSFDPPTMGHLLVVAHVLATEPVDELWMVPVFEHPFRKKLVASFDERAAMCEAALQSIPLPRAKVSRAEADLKGEGRTVDLLEHLHAKHPEHAFALVMGTDLLADKHNWKRFDRIEELARIVVLRRAGYDVPGVSGVVLPEVSSTQVRALLAAGGDARGMVPKVVLDRIAGRPPYGPKP